MAASLYTTFDLLLQVSSFATFFEPSMEIFSNFFLFFFCSTTHLHTGIKAEIEPTLWHGGGGDGHFSFRKQRFYVLACNQCSQLAVLLLSVERIY